MALKPHNGNMEADRYLARLEGDQDHGWIGVAEMLGVGTSNYSKPVLGTTMGPHIRIFLNEVLLQSVAPKTSVLDAEDLTSLSTLGT